MILSDPDPDGPLHGDTLVHTPKGDIKIKDLVTMYEASNTNIPVYAHHRRFGVTQANMTDIRSREISDTYLEIVMADGGVLKCTLNHKWPVNATLLDADQLPNVVVSSYDETSFLAAQYLKQGDRILTSVGSLEIVSITQRKTEPQDWYCGTVPTYGTFYVKSKTHYVRTSNCHINALCLSVLWKTIPHMFEEGKIFVVNAPLYIYSTTSEKFNGSSLKDLMNKVKGKLDHTKVTRIKGYGECSPKDLKEIAFNPETRALTKVDHPRNLSNLVNKAMGKDTAYRKKLLGI